MKRNELPISKTNGRFMTEINEKFWVKHDL